MRGRSYARPLSSSTRKSRLHMFGEGLKERARTLSIGAHTKYATIQRLIIDGVFDRPTSSNEVVLRIRETSGDRWKTIYVQTYMKKFLLAGIVHGVKPSGSRQNFWVLTCMTRAEALKAIGKTQKVRDIEENLFSQDLMSKLKKDFGHELEELHDNFGKNGNCSAFLLRKILEKLIIVTFSKNGREQLLEDSARPGGWKGLKDMIEIAAKEKINGMAFLVPKTANEIKGLKFLGDTAAHNPLVGVDMTSVVPQMPFIVTAYKELAKHLPAPKEIR